MHRRSSFVSDDSLHLVVNYDDLSAFPAEFEELLDKNDIPVSKIESYYSLHGCGHFDDFIKVDRRFINAYMNANLLSHVFLS